jgi:hypothetical protein
VSVIGGNTSPTLNLQTLPNVSGAVEVALTVTDGAGHVGVQVASVQVLPVQPVVSISASSTNVDLGQSINLDGSASAAVGGRTVASYSWSLTSGSGAANFAGSTNAATASLTPTGTGTVSVQLNVTDNLGSVGSRQVDITVLSPMASPTAVISSTSTELGVGQVLVLDANGSLTQTGRPIASYQWTVLSGGDKVAISGASNAATLSLSGLAVGTASVLLTVVDDHGKSSTQSMNLTVSVNQARTIDITAGQSGGGAAESTDVLALLALLGAAVGTWLTSRRAAASQA